MNNKRIHRKHKKLSPPHGRLMDAIPLGLHQWELRPTGELVLYGANPAADRILGIDHRPLIGQPLETIFPRLQNTQIPAIYRQVAQAGGAYDGEQIIYQDGQVEKVFELHAVQSEPFRVTAFFQDTTEKKKSEEALRESEEKFRTLIEQTSVGVILLDEQGRIIEWNAAQEHNTGIPRSEALGNESWVMQYEILPHEARTPAKYEALQSSGQKLLQVMQSAMFYRPMDVTIERRDGQRKIIQQTAFPIKTSSGFRVGSIIRDITAQKQAELDLQRRMVELEALQAVALAGTEATSTDDLLGRVAEIIRQKLFPDHFGVSLLDAKGQVLIYHPIFTKDVYWAGSAIPLDRGITGVVARTRQPRRVGDVHLDPDYLLVNPDTHSELCAPILAGDQVLGVVNLESTTPNRFTEADERLVVALAGELGTALEKIRLLEAERNRRKELEALEQISAVLRNDENENWILRTVLEQVMTALNLESAGFLLSDPATGELVAGLSSGEWAFPMGQRLPPDEGISQRVAVTQRFYLNNDVQADPSLQLPDPSMGKTRCLLCLALIVEGQTEGLLYLGRSTPFQAPDIHLAIAVADAATSALHRIELHQQTRRQLERLTALRAIDQSILSHLDLEQTLNVLLDKIASVLQVDAAQLLLYDPKTDTLTTSARRGLDSPIWDETLRMGETHAGRVALRRKIEYLPHLDQVQDGLTTRIQRSGENFTSYVAVPLLAKGDLEGVLQIFTRAHLDLSADWLGFLEALADQAAIAIHGARLLEEQQQTYHRLTKAYEDTIDGWSRALDLRDKDTQDHSYRVTELTLDLARRMGMTEEELVHIRRGVQLHDIGKMGIPDQILLKPGQLTEAEWEVMRQHPDMGAELLRPIEFLAPAIEIPYCHHEKWDGTGYPRGLKGHEIPLAARIFAVIDVWDALTSNRPYRLAWSKAQALDYIRQQAGKHFDPHVVQEFLVMFQPEIPLQSPSLNTAPLPASGE